MKNTPAMTEKTSVANRTVVNGDVDPPAARRSLTAPAARLPMAMATTLMSSIVTPAGLRHLKKFLPWRDYQEALVAQGRLTVKQAGKWLPWAVLDVSKVPNPHVLYPLIAEARRNRPARKRQPQEDHPG